jgi:hypothetical protein
MTLPYLVEFVHVVCMVVFAVMGKPNCVQGTVMEKIGG